VKLATFISSSSKIPSPGALLTPHRSSTQSEVADLSPLSPLGYHTLIELGELINPITAE
jgi:hypothetical protein